MRKTILAALIIAMGASFNTADAAKKEKKVKGKDVKQTVMADAADSLSYAAGMAQTDGLKPFLKQQHGVEDSDMGDFIRGYREAMAQGMDSKFKAYCAGMQIAIMVNDRMLPSMRERLSGTGDTICTKMFNEGFVDILQGTNVIPDSVAKQLFEDAIKDASMKKHEATRKAGEEFLAENAKKEGVITTESGLQYKVLVKGEGKVPSVDDEVTVKYEGRLIDGTVFDSSYKRNPQTTKFRANQVIKGWTEALTMMPVGSKWELYIPQELAYGERQAGNIPPYSTLIFTVELVE